MKKYTLAFIILVAFLLYIPSLAQASSLAYHTERISGKDRVATSLAISQKGWASAQTVILSEYSAYPDSIAAAPFAVSLDAPILLTGGKSLDPRVIAELQRLQPQKVILLGGEACLTDSIGRELDGLSLSWERIGGENRYATSVLLAERLSGDSLIIANGDKFPDALSAASYAGIKQIPIVLTSKTLPSSVLEYIKRTNPKHIIVIGGEGVVPTESLAKHDLIIENRLGGRDRYDTNARVVEFMKDSVENDDLFLASGDNFPDAVAGTVLAAKMKVPLLLTEKQDVSPATYSVMRQHMKVELPSTTTKSGRGKVTASGGLNLRDTPSASGKLLLTIPEGAGLDISGSQGQWYKTTFQNKNGWVSANYVQVVESYQQGRIIASGGLNLRENPSTSAEVLLTIPQGVTVNVIEEKQEWYKVTYRGSAGWVYAEYLSLLTGYVDGSRSADSGVIDLSVNGKVFILGGTGVISTNTQDIIEGKVNSRYPQNLKEFPSLPSSTNGSDISDSFNPTRDLIDPLQGIIPDILIGKKILIDPGHGGPDSGAIGTYYTFEKENNLAIALYLNDILTEAGAEVSMTRTTDTSVAVNYSVRADLQARVTMANNTMPDLFISIHNNSNPNPDTQGTSTYYSDENPQATASFMLANAVQNAIVGTVNTVDEGLKEADFYVLRNTNVPSILIEAAYISNPYEEGLLRNPIFQKNMASAIFRGIFDYLNH